MSTATPMITQPRQLHRQVFHPHCNRNHQKPEIISVLHNRALALKMFSIRYRRFIFRKGANQMVDRNLRSTSLQHLNKWQTTTSQQWILCNFHNRILSNWVNSLIKQWRKMETEWKPSRITLLILSNPIDILLFLLEWRLILSQWKP